MLSDSHLFRQKEEPNKENQLPTTDRTSIIFTLKHQVGALANALQVFQELGINIIHIELHNGNESETVSVWGDDECGKVVN
jgi:tryptophan 5-monooxygenase